MKTYRLSLCLLMIAVFTSITIAQTQAVRKADFLDLQNKHLPDMEIFDPVAQQLSKSNTIPGYRLKEVFCEFHEITNNMWQNNFQHFYTYVDEQRIDEKLTKKWFNGAWLDYRLESHTYDPLHGQRIEFLLSDNVNGSWENLTRILTEYDSNQRVSISTTQSWDNNQWDDVRRNVFTYDASGRVTEILFQSWDITQWADMNKSQYTYDGSTTVIADIVTLNWSGSVWQNSAKTTYTYNAAGNFTEVLGQIWFSNDWFNSTRLVYTYNGSDQLIETVFQQWDNVSVWNDFSRTQYTYDAMGNQATQLDQWWISNSWVNNTRCTNTWESATGIDDGPATIVSGYHLSNYPNPFNPATRIEYVLPVADQVNITIFNLLGQPVATLLDEHRPAGRHVIDFAAGSLPSGSYFYQLQTAGATIVRRMILLR